MLDCIDPLPACDSTLMCELCVPVCNRYLTAAEEREREKSLILWWLPNFSVLAFIDVALVFSMYL